MAVTLSVAVVTRNRPESLARCLQSLRRQEVQPHEVVVSDDSNDPQNEQDNRAIAEKFDCRYLPGPRRGLYANRNFAARNCTGSHVRSMDDDHEFPPGHFVTCTASVQSDPLCVWVIGECYPERDGSLGPALAPGQLTATGFSKPPADADDYWAISDGASIYPRTIFDVGHAFSEAFTFGASYLEFGSYLKHMGYRLRHLPDTFVVHHLDPSNRSVMDVEVDVASRIFAMLCFSFMYRPSPLNMVTSSVKLFQYALLHSRRPLATPTEGFKAFLERRRQVLAQR